ncbi:CD209 antigen-like protein 2 [Biomphalaria pfeifferi]|uniref:CD209 antigen-like protein 2 n=1 Tax=Biomphalaria pfeifferi TaxID=112525 RepID=A0AAD8BYF8_BIOPF|nr:CD209 antigen-like protein 2 [Biomphalaria pfeifferi]
MDSYQNDSFVNHQQTVPENPTAMINMPMIDPSHRNPTATSNMPILDPSHRNPAAAINMPMIDPSHRNPTATSNMPILDPSHRNPAAAINMPMIDPSHRNPTATSNRPIFDPSHRNPAAAINMPMIDPSHRNPTATSNMPIFDPSHRNLTAAINMPILDPSHRNPTATSNMPIFDPSHRNPTATINKPMFDPMIDSSHRNVAHSSLMAPGVPPGGMATFPTMPTVLMPLIIQDTPRPIVQYFFNTRHHSQNQNYENRADFLDPNDTRPESLDYDDDTESDYLDYNNDTEPDSLDHNNDTEPDSLNRNNDTEPDSLDHNNDTEPDSLDHNKHHASTEKLLEVAPKTKTCSKLNTAILINFLVMIFLLLPILACILDIGNTLEAKLDQLNDLLEVQRNVTENSGVAKNINIRTADTCICLYEHHISWYNAREFCLNLASGSHLAEIHTKEDNELLMPLLHNSNISREIWVGGCNWMSPRIWTWNYTGKPIRDGGKSSLWNHEVGSRQCLVVSSWDNANYKWNAMDCNDKKSFVCSIKLVDAKCLCKH